MSAPPRPEDYPRHSQDKLRYGDTDRLGHVNNAAFSTFLETGRVELLHDPAAPLNAPGCSFVIVRLEIDYVAEILWPGAVDIATRVGSVGRSSMRLEQALFQDGRLVATAASVVVHFDLAARKSRPLPGPSVAALEALRRPAARA
jgi:acyl-CoA thioester hydrolase